MSHNIYFELKYENSKNKSTENCHFYSREILLYIAWACLRNDLYRIYQAETCSASRNKGTEQLSY